MYENAQRRPSFLRRQLEARDDPLVADLRRGEFRVAGRHPCVPLLRIREDVREAAREVARSRAGSLVGFMNVWSPSMPSGQYTTSPGESCSSVFPLRSVGVPLTKKNISSAP
jgi:hypothetical protein